MATTKKKTKASAGSASKKASATSTGSAAKGSAPIDSATMIATKLLIQTAQQVAAEEEKIARKWNEIFKKKLGQLVLFKTIKDKKQQIYGWAAEDGFFLRGIKYKNEIFVENFGWPDMETANGNGDDPTDEAKRKFKKPKFTTDQELWILDAKECLVFPHTTTNEKVAQKFNSLLGDDLTLQNKHNDLVDEYGAKHKKIEANLDLIDDLQVKIIKTLASLKK